MSTSHTERHSVEADQIDYLTIIIPWAWMGYWLKGHEGNNAHMYNACSLLLTRLNCMKTSMKTSTQNMSDFIHVQLSSNKYTRKLSQPTENDWSS